MYYPVNKWLSWVGKMWKHVKTCPEAVSPLPHCCAGEVQLDLCGSRQNGTEIKWCTRQGAICDDSQPKTYAIACASASSWLNISSVIETKNMQEPCEAKHAWASVTCHVTVSGLCALKQTESHDFGNWHCKTMMNWSAYTYSFAMGGHTMIAKCIVAPIKTASYTRGINRDAFWLTAISFR